MRELIKAIAFIAALPGLAFASEEGPQLDHLEVDLTNKASLQRGAKLFTNYCLSCHSADYVRYNRVGNDIGLTDDEVKQNLLFAADKVGETMSIAMPKARAKEWFGKAPPDLSVIARARGADWLYTYLRTFYVDPSRPFGVNNKVFPDVGMPHVLAGLQGLQKPVFETHTLPDGGEEEVLSGFEPAKPGSMTPAEYDKAVGDLVNFLVYIGEPMQLERQRMGWWVLGFLAVFFVVAYLLKKEYWKDVH